MAPPGTKRRTDTSLCRSSNSQGLHIAAAGSILPPTATAGTRCPGCCKRTRVACAKPAYLASSPAQSSRLADINAHHYAQRWSFQNCLPGAIPAAPPTRWVGCHWLVDRETDGSKASTEKANDGDNNPLESVRL